jgi:ATP-dependent RNA helicase RhlE
MSFTSFDLHPRIMAGVQALGYTIPTPIQLQAIPPVLQGCDVLGLAQTGTGKTAAFVLPILQRLMKGPGGRLRALILAPTRELAEQIHTVTGALGQHTSLRQVTLYGGVGMQPQVQKLRTGVDIAVACPGRLLDHISQGTINLSHLEVLVLDEADRLFDMGFLPDIRRIVRHVPAQRQTLLFSATMPEAIWHLAQDILRTPVTVQVDHTVPLPTISHALYPVAPHLKTALLAALFRHTKPTSGLVFTRTKHQAKRVAHHLAQAGYRATSLQGNLSQSKRQAALEGFRSGAFEILVATDLAARGLDVWHISHVINYDMPETVDAYMHRIGRTGRAARTGVAFTLVTHDDAAMVSTLERALGAPLERRTLHGFEYATPRSAHDTDRGRAPRGRQPQRAQATAAYVGARSGPNTREEPSGATPAPPLPSAPGRSPQRSPGRRWQPAAAVRHWW